MMTLAASDFTIPLAIAGAALVTYGLRLGGLLLAEKLPPNGGFQCFMESLPGSILVALVAPGIVSAGVLGAAAAFATALCAWRTKNVLASMLLGMVIVALGRAFG